ncbi:MAG: hypothetical protein RLZZ155_222, partial [Bacteroidota bacterium]
MARSWTGDNGGTWTASLARTDQTITTKAIAWTANGANVLSPSYSGGMGTLTFKYVRAFTGTGARSIEVYVNSVKIGSTITVSGTSDVVVTYSSAINVSGNVVLEIRNTGSNQVKVDDISWTAYSAPTPTITSSGSLSAVNTTYGTASASPATFNVLGANMSAGILVTPPAGYEVCLTSNGTYTSTVTVGTSGTIVSTPVYVRLKSNASVAGSPYSGNIALTSSGATAVNVATVSSTVSAKALTIAGLSAANKNYDGTTTVSVTGTAAYSGLVNGESFTPSDVVTWAFPDANVGTNKVLTRTGTYSNPSSNYTLTQPSLTANISAVVPSAPIITAINPGNAQLSVDFTAPTANGGASITNYEYSTNNGGSFTAFSPAQTTTPLVISGLTNGVTYDVRIRAVNSVGSGAASNMIPGTPAAPADPTITVAPALFASNFSTTYGTASASQTFTIAAAAIDQDLLVTAPTGFEISLNNNTGFASSLTLAQSSGEVASTTIYARLLATASAGNYNSSIFTISGGGAPDVNITTSSTGNAVNAKALTITGLSAGSKNYDGNTSATLSGTASYSGLVNGESFAIVGSATATFFSANAGNGIAVTVTGFSAPSSNYSITQPSYTADITAVNLTISGISISNKVYNGTNAATITGAATYQGLVNSESFSVTGTPLASFSSANVGTGISVTVSGYTAPTANYTVTQPTGLTADITKANQTITFGALANQTTATVTDYSPGATSATSGVNAITYTSSNTSVATIVGGLIHIVGAGTTSITASQASSTNYNATSSAQTLTVTLAPIVLAGWDFNAIVSGTTYNTYTATTFSTDLVSAASANTITRGSGAPWSTAGNSFRTTGFQNNGISTANTDYFQVTLQPISGKLVSLNSINAKFAGTATFYASPGVTSQFAYSLDGTNFTLIGQPFVTLTASLTSTPSIDLSGVTALQNIPSGTTITLRYYASGQTTTGGWGFASAAAGTNGLAISGIISNPLSSPTLIQDETANTVDNNIDITYAADAAWTSAINAVKIGATSLTPTTDYVITSGNIQLLPSGGNSLLTTAGTKTITIVASGYTNATVTQVINAGIPTSNSTVTINSLLTSGATRTITCTAKDQYNNLVSGYTFTYDATLVTANATTTESYSIDGSAVTSSVNNVSLSSATNASGASTFTIVMPSALDEADGISIQVQLANGSTNVGTLFAYHELPSQTITFNALDAKTYGDASFSLIATGGASGNPVVFTSSNTNVATCTGINGSTVTIIGAGSATIKANQTGSAGYNAAAEVSQTLVVNQKALTISGVSASDKVYNGSSAATITGSPVYVGLVNSESFSVSGTGAAAFSDAEAGVGKTVNFSGYTAPSANYSLTQPTATATISQAAQSISFSSLPNRFVGAPAFTLTQNATSGLAITYSSSNTLVATIVGNTVTPVGAGTTTITATQSGNNNYTAAVTLTQDLTVIATPIAGWDFFGQTSPATFAATTFNSNLDGTGGLNEITRGSGATANSAGNSFSTTGFQNNGISISNTDYFQVTLKANTGYNLSLSEINANFDGTGSFYATPGVTSQYAYSLDGTNFTLIGDPVTSTFLKPAAVDLTGVSALQNLTASTTVTIRYYASGQTTSGGWRFSSPSAGVLGLSIGGSLCQLPAQLSLSSSSFCNNGETAVVSSTTSETGMTYELYDTNGAVSNSSKAGTGSALSWTGLNSGVYYVVGTNNLGGCTTTSSSITLTATVPSYPYYPDTDGDGFGAGTVLLSCSATAPANYSTLSTDCNDNNAAIRPNATEVCGDGIDNNCDNNETYPNQYRSAVESGDWSVASTWEKSCSEGIWEAALIAPSNQYFNASTPFAVTIQSGNSVTVSTTSITNFAKAGSLTVAGNLIVNGNLTITSSVINSGTVTINHGASFVQTNQVVGNNNSGNGNFIVNMNLTGTNNNTAPNGRYWYLGSPMNNTVASLFFDQPKMVRLWSYEPSNNSWVTLINSSTTPSGATNSTVLVPSLGYLYRAGFDKTIQFVGDATKFNNNITTPLALTGAGYKYVANPYTSHIDWRQVTRTGLNVSYWIRNATNTAYEAYNATSGVSTPSGTQTTQFIPPMQGFWVYAFTTSSSLRIDNGDRTHSTNGLHAPQHNQIVRLNLNDGKTDDQAVVYENENASNGIEEYDTDKFMDENHHQVYFLEGTKQLTLDGLKDATAKQKVDMGIQITSAGTYTINAVELGVEEDVVLEDKFTHTFQDLKRNSTYSFTSNAGTYNNRFVLHFTLNPQTETAIESVEVRETVGETEGVNIYTTTGQQVKVWVTNTADFQNATVKVYDAIGNLIERKNMTSNEL